jgi:hypothetical protein
MKNFDLTSMGVQEMDLREMQETDGGFIWVLVVAACVLLSASSCNNNNNYSLQIGTGNSSEQKGGGTMSADSTLNGNSLTVPPPVIK